MPDRARTRELIYLPIAGGQPAPFPGGIPGRAWNTRSAGGPADVMRVLALEPAACFAGLLDIRVGVPPGGSAQGLPEALLRVLACGRIAWVAIVRSGQIELPWVRELIGGYCHDYVVLPCGDALLAAVLGHAHGMALLRAHGGARPAPGCEGMVGESPAMQAMYRRLQRAASTDAPVCIAGETGTGKELAAAAIHRGSARRNRPFVVINCGAIPQSLVESELFGYERGAFTGATQRKLGRIELANHGSLFLDEVGDLPMEAQASLLRFLEAGTIQHLGGRDDIATDARIISATHVELSVAVAAGRFREDLFHRLRVIELRMPPLRERNGDIVLIANHALARHAGEAGHFIRGFSRDALRALHVYPWPGNVRELVNRVREAVVMAEGHYITAYDLRLAQLEGGNVPQTLDAARCEGERAAIERALERNSHHLCATAHDLGISRVTLYRLMNRHGLRGHAPLEASKAG